MTEQTVLARLIGKMLNLIFMVYLKKIQTLLNQEFTTLVNKECPFQNKSFQNL